MLAVMIQKLEEDYSKKKTQKLLTKPVESDPIRDILLSNGV
jgi:hypothetical protein